MLVLAATAFGGTAEAQPAPPSLQVRSLAATCAGCHGTDGKPVEGASLPSLAGTPRDAMISQMKAFRDGSRPATIMHQLAKGYTDAQIEQLAGYFASLR
jgi:cytochrome subunit of sulfide dehydrogenase